MYLDGDRLVLSPSDLVAHLCCPHVTELSLAVALGTRARPASADPEVEVVRRRGVEHEQRFLAALVKRGTRVVEIPEGPLDDQVAATLDALGEGPDVVYQAAFFHAADGGPAWRGHADFCHRVDQASALGGHSYEPSDTKLARHVTPSAVLQLCEYAAHLARIQGIEPEQVHVVLGGAQRESLRLADFSAYHRSARARFAEAAGGRHRSYPLPNAHCAVCPWLGTCEARWKAEDHLVRVAGLTVEQAKRLASAGVTTASGLAVYEGPAISGIGAPTLDRLRHQARLQRAAVPGRPPPYELIETAGAGWGLGALPPPSPGDLFFDIEGDPFVGATGIEYLWGAGWAEPDGSSGFRALWAHTETEERRAFEAFIDLVTSRRAADPQLHVYHFAPYETAAVTRLMGRYGTREDEVDELLRAGVFVDLHRVVRQAVRVGTPSYSLKKLEALYMGRRTDTIVDAGSSIVQYERWLQEQDPGILDAIEVYNRTDCASTQKLRDWLEALRAEYAARFGTGPPRPAARDGARPEGVEEEAAAVDELAAALVGGAGDVGAGEGGGGGAAPTTAAARLLGHLLEWHRREEKPAWWQFFRRVGDLDEDGLFEDAEALARLDYQGPVGRVRRSTVHRYTFDPGQEHKLRAGDRPVDPAAERRRARGEDIPAVGSIVAMEPVEGTVDLMRGSGSTAPHPRCLIPGGPVRTTQLRRAIRRVAAAVVEHGIDGTGPYRAARDLLLRRPPRLTTGLHPSGVALVAPGEDPSDAAVRLAHRLDGGCLAVQGPPGSGKTAAAARTAVELMAAGQRVGITANSHAVISHLLQAVLALAATAQRPVEVRACQKADDDERVDDPRVVACSSNEQAEAHIDGDSNLFAGTAWLFARPAFDGRLDHLIVDEAGQLSLANAVAVSAAARNLVLVGDPRQLAQPSQGAHPDGAEASALGHLLGDRDTMPPDLGVFLERTHRLHPDICRFVSEVVYDGRLVADDECARQRVGGDGPLAGSGLRWRAVAHSGNRCSSPEEVDVVAALYADLLGRTFVGRDIADTDGHSIGTDDILVVAPYNAQVSLLGHTLPPGARVGTVDKFQGQEAPVVIVSLAASSLDDIPRGMEFLYSRNRLNVAVSRAQALSVVVGSPALLTARCRTVHQLRLVNGLCRLVELAQRC